MITNYIKFALIFFCFIISLSHKKNISTTVRNIQVTALFLTVVSDFFLVIVNWERIGIFVFIFVQICYSIRLRIKRHLFLIYPIIFTALFLILNETLIILALFYGFLFLTNYIYAWKNFIHQKFLSINSYLILIGLSLFLLCDISVAMYNMHHLNIDFSDDFLHFLRYSIWIFYIPSQFLLSISSRKFRSKPKQPTY